MGAHPLCPLNPVRAGLVADPRAWEWSSYPGYADRRRRRDGVAYDDLLAAWEGATGGPDSAAAYRRFMTAGLADPPPSPWSQAGRGWILGSGAFAQRLRREVNSHPPNELRRESRELRAIDLPRLIKIVTASYQMDAEELSRKGSRHPARAALAYLARRTTGATNATLVPLLGLSRPESVPNLTRRFAHALETHPRVRALFRRLTRAIDSDDDS